MLKVDRARLEELGEDEKKELLEALAEVDAIYQANPLQQFRPMPKQAEFLSAAPPDTRTKMYAGGNRAGKTTVGVVDDLIQAVDRDVLPAHLQQFKWCDPPFFGRVIVPSFDALEMVQLQEFRALGPASQFKGHSFDSGFDKQHKVLRFQNGSLIDFLTFEVDLDKVGGVKRHRTRFDEEPKGEKGHAMFHESRMRGVDFAPTSQISFTMTPLLGISWAFDEVWEKRFEPGFAGVQSSMYDNIYLSRDEVKLAERGLTDEERRSRIEGEFVHFKGLVYSELRDDVHVVPTPERDHVGEQEVVVGIDPGIRWTGVVWVGFDNDNSALVFDELLLEGYTVDEISNEIRSKNREWGVTPDYVIDPSARNRSAVNADQVEAAFARNDIYCQHGQNALEAGVFEVKRRLQGRMLTVSEDCGRLLWEFARYRMDEKADGTFTVVKENDHELDALRYAVMSRAWNIASTPVMERRRPGWIPGVSMPYHPEPVGSSPPLGSMS